MVDDPPQLPGRDGQTERLTITYLPVFAITIGS
jgi:hypothetical protein